MSEPNFNAFSLLAYLLFQFRVPVKLFFVNSRRFYLNKCCELKQRFLHVWHDTAPIIWNSLPLHLRSFTISREQFRALSAPTYDSPPRTIEEWNYLLTYLLTMQLTSGVDVFAHVCGQKTDTWSNYCDKTQPHDNTHFSFFSNVTRILDGFLEITTNSNF